MEHYDCPLDVFNKAVDEMIVENWHEACYGWDDRKEENDKTLFSYNLMAAIFFTLLFVFLLLNFGIWLRFHLIKKREREKVMQETEYYNALCENLS